MTTRIAALLLSASIGWLPACGHAQTLKLRLLETTDIHMNLLPWDYYQDQPVDDYGLARTATLIKAARAENPNTVLLDNGDLLQGSPMGDAVARTQPLSPGPAEKTGQVHPAYRVLKALGYDAANVGNHEFNYGLEFLRRSLAGAGLPVVNANLFVDNGRPEGGEPAFAPYVLLKRRFSDEAGQPQTLSIGVLGLTPPQVLQWDRQHLLGKIVARDIVATARLQVPLMKAAGADVVVVLAHSGFERVDPARPPADLSENAVARLAEVAGVDAVLFGHSHGEFPGRAYAGHPKADIERGTINGVAAVMPGFWGSHLGVVDLVLAKSAAGWQVSSGRGSLRAVFDRAARQPLVAADAEVVALVQAEHNATRAWLGSPVATTRAPLHSYFAQVQPDASVALVAQAQADYARRALAGTPLAALPLLSAAAPFKSGGRGGIGNYTDIPAGPLTLRNVADLYLYPNTLQVVKLSGAQVREWLEFAAGAFNRIDPAGPGAQPLLNPAFPSFNFDTLHGLSYRYDLTQPARYNRDGQLVAASAQRVQDLRHDGSPIDAAAEFLVVTNNYRAAGGGNFPGLDGSRTVLAAPDETRQVLQDYLQRSGSVDSAAGLQADWGIAAVPGVALRLSAGRGALRHLPGQSALRLVQENADGTLLLELAPGARP